MNRIAIERTNLVVVLGKRNFGKTFLIRFLVREADFENTRIYNGNLDDDYLKTRDFPDGDNIKVIKRRFTSPEWDSFNDENSFKDQFVVIDEADLVNYNHPNFYREFINVGRHVNSGGILAARRPTMLPRDITANADWTFIFRSRERSVQDFIKASYTDEVSDLAATLDRTNYEFLIVDPSQEPVCKARVSEDGKELVVIEEYDTNAPVSITIGKVRPRGVEPPLPSG